MIHFHATVGLIPCHRSDMVNLPTMWYVLPNQHNFFLYSKHSWQKSVWAGWKDAPLSNHGMCEEPFDRGSAFTNPVLKA
jgi:hypothetical protein